MICFFLPLFSFRLEHLGTCQQVLGEWLVLILQLSEWLVDPLVRSQDDCSAAGGPETTSEKETENESDH